MKADPIAAVTRDGLRLASGAEHELDVLVFATGFDALTGPLLSIDIRGADGVSLREAWADGPRTHLGLGVAGFPDLFTITGPGSPSVLTNMPTAIEQHVDWIADLLVRLRETGETRGADRGRAGRVGRAGAGGGGRDAAPAGGQLLVPGRERARQAAGLPALRRRDEPLPGAVRRGGGGGLPGVRPPASCVRFRVIGGIAHTPAPVRTVSRTTPLEWRPT